MVFVEWDESYSVGNALLDAHHKIFFEMVKKFSENPCLNDRHALELRVEFLLDYIAMHFVAEETLLRQINYPDFDRHKAEHDNFYQTALSMYMDKDVSNYTEDEMLHTLQDWFENHVLGEDRRCAPYIKAKPKDSGDSRRLEL